MAFECYRVVVPEDARLAGYTVAGQRVQIAPGEYVVHRMRPKVPLRGVCEALRFLGADERGHDLHIPLFSDTDAEHLQLAGDGERIKGFGSPSEGSTRRSRPWATKLPPSRGT